MIVRGMPKNISDYYLTDGDEAFRLQQSGVIPAFVDEDAVYFKKNKKLKKALIKFGVKESEIDF